MQFHLNNMVFVLEDRASPTCVRLLTTLLHFQIVAARLTSSTLICHPKAHDKVSHGRLVHTLIQAGFGGNLLNWFCSYLSGRRYRVTVLGATSEDLPVTSGVPQGSILGPAFFLLYVNDLPEVISSSSRVLMIADDTKIFREIKTLGDASSLREDLGKLATWSQSSGLLFNEAKCIRRSTLQGKQSRSYPLTNSTTPQLNYLLQKLIWAYGLVRI